MLSAWIGAALIATGAPASPVAVVDAERAFAAEVARSGFKRGFLAFAAEDAVWFSPGPVNVRQSLSKAPDDPPGAPLLVWWPEWAGISSGGDFGFTTGPATSPVRYFTIWRKQPEGGWKWIYDGGVPAGGRMPGGADTRPTYLVAASDSAGSADRALAEIAPIEAAIAGAAATDARAALTPHLAKEALVATPGLITYPGRDHAAALAARAKAQVMRPIGGAAAAKGDMAYTYGESRWADGSGHYVRVWQRRAEGWRLVADLLVPAATAEAAAS